MGRGKGAATEQKDMTGQAIKAAITSVVQEAIQHKVESQIWKNIERAAQSSKEKVNWMEIIECFVESFCSSTISAYEKESWFHSLDLSQVVEEAVYDKLPAAQFRGVHPQHLREFLHDRFSESYARILQEVHVDRVAWETSEELFGREKDKAMFKKLSVAIRKSWTQTRDAILEEMINNQRRDPADLADDFAKRWIDNACGRLFQSIDDVHQLIPKEVTMRKFQEMFQRSCLPTPLSDIIGPPPKGWSVINRAVREAYSGGVKGIEAEYVTKKSKKTGPVFLKIWPDVPGQRREHPSEPGTHWTRQDFDEYFKKLGYDDNFIQQQWDMSTPEGETPVQHPPWEPRPKRFKGSGENASKGKGKGKASGANKGPPPAPVVSDKMFDAENVEFSTLPYQQSINQVEWKASPMIPIKQEVAEQMSQAFSRDLNPLQPFQPASTAPPMISTMGNVPAASAAAGLFAYEATFGQMRCPECVNGVNCKGGPIDDLYKHNQMERYDIYCSTCWADFTLANPNAFMEGELIPRSSLPGT